MKNKVIIIVLAVLFVMTLIMGGIGFFYKNRKVDDSGNKERIEPLKISKIYTIPRDIISINEYYYTLENKEIMSVYSLDGKFIYKGNKDEDIILNNKFIMIFDINNEYYKKVLDSEGKEVLSKVKLSYIDSFDEKNTDYYFGDSSFYDENLNKIMDMNVKYNNNLIVYNDYVINLDKKEVYNLKTKQRLFNNYNDVINYDEYLIIIYKDHVDLLNMINNEINRSFSSNECYYVDEETNYNPIYCKLKKGKDNYYLIDNKLYINKVNLDNILNADYSSCKRGAKLYNNQELISDVCYGKYTRVNNSVVIAESDNNYKDALFVNNKKITEKPAIIEYDGNIIIVRYEDEYKGKTYNTKGELVKDNDLNYNGNYNYYEEGFNKITYYDKDLNVLFDNAKDYECNNDNACVLKVKNNNYYLYNKNIKADARSFSDVRLFDNVIYVSTLFDTYALILGPGNETIKEENIYNSVDLDKVIKDYHLEDIKEKIYKDKDFYKKYSYLVENNSGVSKYKEYMYKLLKEVVDVKENIDENKFLTGIKDLKFKYDRKIRDNNSLGEYNDGETTISIVDKNSDNDDVVMHELTHFLDARINDPSIEKVYLCDNQLSLEYKNGCKEYDVPVSNIAIEGGAELYKGKYYTNTARVYQLPVSFLTGIEYIYGSDFLKELFFSPNTNYNLLKLFMDNGYTYEEYNDINNAFSYVVYPLRYDKNDYYEKNNIFDPLIKFYSNKNKDKNWINDKNFISIFAMNDDIEKTKYIDYLGNLEEVNLKLTTLMDESSAILKLKNDKKILSFYYPVPILLNNELYFTHNISYKDNLIRNYYFNVKYDFNSNKIADYKLIETN